MIIGKLDYEQTIYVNELTPMDSSLSVITSDEVDVLEISIQPEDTTSFNVLGDDKKMTYAFTSVGSKTITLKIKTTTTPDGLMFTFPVNVVDSPNVFATDADLAGWVPKISQYLSYGYSSFIRTHVQVRNLIISAINQRGVRALDGSRLSFDDLAELDEVADWAQKFALQLIFEDLIVKPDDSFDEKSKYYKLLADIASSIPSISIKNSDDTKTVSYGLGIIGVRRA